MEHLSIEKQELELTQTQILGMIESVIRVDCVQPSHLAVFASDSYGPHKHRTWIFYTEEFEIVGSLERYWNGLKMICSVFGGNPRTSFFTEDGTRTTNRGLKTP